MRVAFVYDLRDDYLALGWSEEAVAEFDTGETVDAIAAALARNGAEVSRVGNGRALAGRLAAGERWDLVFSIAEGASGRSREAQVPALCELFDQPYAFSDPLTMALTLDKPMAKRVVRDAGIATAPFTVLEQAPGALEAGVEFPAFAKPVAEGTGKGCSAASRVNGHDELRAVATSLLARFSQPVLVETYLPGREFTVGIVGTGREASVIGVLEVSLVASEPGAVYSFLDKELCETRVRYTLADDAAAQKAGKSALSAYRVLGCRDAARLDYRCDAKGEPQFLEANPIAGLHPTHSDLPILTQLGGRSYDWLIGEILRSAVQRGPQPARAGMAAG